MLHWPRIDEHRRSRNENRRLGELERGVGDDSIEHTLSERNTEIDGSGSWYHGIDVRFLPGDTKENLLQKFTDKLENKVAWYRVGYHACNHRDGDGSSGPCSFDPAEDPEAIASEWTDKDVTIPSSVPSFPDAAFQ